MKFKEEDYKLCKNCKQKFLDDGYDYGLCIPCYARIINCEIKVVN